MGSSRASGNFFMKLSLPISISAYSLVHVFSEFPPKSSVLTALSLIRTIATVIEGIAHPCFWDAVSVSASELAGQAGGWNMCGAVILIGSITTVIMPITAPTSRDAVLVPAGEGIWRAGCS